MRHGVDSAASTASHMELDSRVFFQGDDLITSPQFPNLQLTADQILRTGESLETV